MGSKKQNAKICGLEKTFPIFSCVEMANLRDLHFGLV